MSGTCAAFQFPSKPLQSAVQVFVDSFFRQPKPGGDVTSGQSLKLAKHHNLTLAGRQRVKGCDQQGFKLVGVQRHMGIRGRVGNGVERDLVRHAVVARAPEHIDGEIASDPKEEGTRRSKRRHGVFSPEAEVGLLHNVVDVAHTGKDTTQIGTQMRLVRLNLFNKPFRVVKIGHRGRILRRRHNYRGRLTL